MTHALPTEYWLAPQALNITLNAMGDPNKTLGSTAAGAMVMCFVKSIDGVIGTYDNGHSYRRWTLQAYNTAFGDDNEKYVYIAIPRDATKTTALVVFPSVEIDIYGISHTTTTAEDGTSTEKTTQVGSADYYYIYLHARISSTNGTTSRTWLNEDGTVATACTINTGSLSTDAAIEAAIATIDELLRGMFTPVKFVDNAPVPVTNLTDMQAIRANKDFFGVGGVAAYGFLTDGGGGTTPGASYFRDLLDVTKPTSSNLGHAWGVSAIAEDGAPTYGWIQASGASSFATLTDITKPTSSDLGRAWGVSAIAEDGTPTYGWIQASGASSFANLTDVNAAASASLANKVWGVVRSGTGASITYSYGWITDKLAYIDSFNNGIAGNKESDIGKILTVSNIDPVDSAVTRCVWKPITDLLTTSQLATLNSGITADAWAASNHSHANIGTLNGITANTLTLWGNTVEFKTGSNTAEGAITIKNGTKSVTISVDNDGNLKIDNDSNNANLYATGGISAYGYGVNEQTGVSKFAELEEVVGKSWNNGQTLVYSNGSWIAGTAGEKYTGDNSTISIDSSNVISVKSNVFAAYTHYHDERYVTELSKTGDSLTWKKNGAWNEITVPFATKSESIVPEKSDDLDGLAQYRLFQSQTDLTKNTTNGLPASGWYNGITFAMNGDDRYRQQIAIVKGQLYTRYRNGDSAGWQPWLTNIDSSNIGSQTVAIAGQCTGNSATASRLQGSGKYSAWGQEYWSDGVPKTVSGNMTGVGTINGKHEFYQDGKAYHEVSLMVGTNTDDGYRLNINGNSMVNGNVVIGAEKGYQARTKAKEENGVVITPAETIPLMQLEESGDTKLVIISAGAWNRTDINTKMRGRVFEIQVSKIKEGMYDGGYTALKVSEENGLGVTELMSKNNGTGALKIGNGLLRWDSQNNALYVETANGGSCGFYATGGVAAYSNLNNGTGSAASLVNLSLSQKLTAQTVQVGDSVTITNTLTTKNATLSNLLTTKDANITNALTAIDATVSNAFATKDATVSNLLAANSAKIANEGKTIADGDYSLNVSDAGIRWARIYELIIGSGSSISDDNIKKVSTSSSKTIVGEDKYLYITIGGNEYRISMTKMS